MFVGVSVEKKNTKQVVNYEDGGNFIAFNDNDRDSQTD